MLNRMDSKTSNYLSANFREIPRFNLRRIQHLRNSCCLIILLFSFLHISAQDRFQLSLETRPTGKRIPEKTIIISKTAEEILIDGKLSEEIWKSAEMATGFHQQFPFDDTAATAKTEVRLAYDDNNLYASIICYDEVPGKYIVESLRRDFNERHGHLA